MPKRLTGKNDECGSVCAQFLLLPGSRIPACLFSMQFPGFIGIIHEHFYSEQEDKMATKIAKKVKSVKKKVNKEAKALKKTVSKKVKAVKKQVTKTAKKIKKKI